MDNTLLISKYILAQLESSEAVTEILGDDPHKIFPMIQPDSLTYPYIVYQRTSLMPTYTKDVGLCMGWTNSINITIKCISDDYVNSLELANAVRNSLEGFYLQDEYIKIDPVEISSATEYTVDDVYVQEIILNINAE